MADKDMPMEIPPFEYESTAGKKTRMEMDQWLREKYPRIHWLRIRANKDLGLPKQVSWDMKEIVLRHWMLDEMIRRQYIVGDVLGVNRANYNDDAEIRQFVQKLSVLVQSGSAVSPQFTEGVDMSAFTPPPPPVMGAPSPNGQPATQFTPPMPPGPPAPSGPAFVTPPAPQITPPTAPPQATSPQSAPTEKRGRRPKQEQTPVVQEVVTQSGSVFVPPAFVPPAAMGTPVSAPVVGTAIPVSSDDTAIKNLEAKIDKLTASIATLAKDNAILNYKLDVSCLALSIVGRTMTGRQGTADVEAWLKELGIPLPKAP